MADTAVQTGDSLANVVGAASTGLQTYMDKAVGVLKDYGFLEVDNKETAMAGVLQELVHIDEAKVLAIASILKLSGAYNKMVRDNLESIKVDDRYKTINELFDSVREDLFTLVKHTEDGKIDMGEKVSQAWMKLARGSPHKRFEKIYDTNGDVQKDTKNSVDRLQRILDGYGDFRLAYKHGGILSNEVLQMQEKTLEQKRAEFEAAQKTVTEYQGTNVVERGRLELVRDEARRVFEKEDGIFQTITDFAKGMDESYVGGELIFANFKQGFDLIKRVYQRSVIFAGTHDVVFTGLDTAYSSKMVLHEATEVQDGMQRGAGKGIEALAEVSGPTHKKAVEVGYGKMIDASSLRKLADSVVKLQQELVTDVQAAREGAAANTAEAVKIYQETQEKLANILTALPAKTAVAAVPA